MQDLRWKQAIFGMDMITKTARRILSSLIWVQPSVSSEEGISSRAKSVGAASLIPYSLKQYICHTRDVLQDPGE